MNASPIKSEVLTQSRAEPWYQSGKKNTIVQRIHSWMSQDQMKKFFLLNLLLSILALRMTAQRAELHVVNHSSRQLTVKIMKKSGARFSLLQIGPQGRSTGYFEHTGEFFLKTKAVLSGKEILYKKGDPFRVLVGSGGYSILTITYSINESAASNPMDGEQISRDEFEKDE